jgi:RimJ/RimL family protein N-acetyltransferase
MIIPILARDAVLRESDDDRSARRVRECGRHEGAFEMTLAHGTDRLESTRLVLRRIAPEDLPFFTRIHALPEVAQHLYPGGKPRSPEQTAAWLQGTLASYEELGIGSLAVLRREDGALIGRCGLTDLAVESAAAEHALRRGWFGRAQAPAGVALTFECELSYTFDPVFWRHGFATEAARCVLDYTRDVLRLSYAISAILPQNARSRRVAERLGARLDGQMQVVGLTWDRWVWPLATGDAARLQPSPP